MNLNPFVTDIPVGPEDLIDREAEWRKLVELAEGGHNSRLSAPRRYGKTSLLNKVEERAESRLGMAIVAVDFFGVVSLTDVALRVEDAYTQGLKGPLAQWFAGVKRKWRPGVRAGVPGSGIDITAASEEDSERVLMELLDLPKRVHERSGKSTLVVFDEFQDVLSASDSVDGLIRSRIQHHRHQASYIFAGSHPGLMAELFGSKTRPLYGQTRSIRIGPLGDEDLAEYIGQRFADSGRDAGAALSPLLELVRGHPQRAMLAAHHLWDQIGSGDTADELAWNNALEGVLSDTEEAFEQIWESLTTNQRRVLAAVAWIGPWGQGDSLFSHSTLSRFRLTKGTARDVQTSLLTSGELERVGEQKVRLVDPIFELWIASGRRVRS